MITTYYRGYRLHTHDNRTDIWSGLELIDVTTDEADAIRLVDSWMVAP